VRIERSLAALAVLFLIAHLVFLPTTLEDLDSINFALGVRDFDVARHQPHPPGYPVFIALAKVSTAVMNLAGIPGAAPRGLALLSAVSGTALVLLLFAFYRIVCGDPRIAWWAMALAVCSPVFWFTAIRPLSDMTGLAFVVAAQLLLFAVLPQTHAIARAGPNASASEPPGFRPATLLIAAAALCGLAAGVRAQTVMLTVPLLIAVLVWPRTTLTFRDRVVAAGAAAAAVLVWAIPLIVASGGPSGYLAALGTQAGEDFSGVVMLWTVRQARVAAYALLYSFVWPWGALPLGVAVMAIALAGFARLGWRAPRMLILVIIAFGPYAVFHLLFHETVTVRYALPLVVPVALLGAYGAAALGRAGLTITGATLCFPLLALSVPATRAYARDGSPPFRLMQRFIASSASGASGGPQDGVIGLHASMRRVEEWEHANHHARVLRALHGREWLALIEHWRKQPGAPVWFLADPRRTDLALFDPHARRLVGSERWTFPEMPFVAGTRPGAADAFELRPPGWMLDRGWSLTAEIGGLTAREGLGPHVEPTVAWARARAEPASAIIGGRNLGAKGDPAARLTLGSDAGPIGTSDATPGFFLWHVQLPAGTLLGDGYVPLRLTAGAADGSGCPVLVSLEQFDLQTLDEVMFGYGDGWHEPEYSQSAGQWRWMSERARVWVKPVGRDVTLTIAGESPLRYFDKPPVVRVLVAGVEVGRFSPAADFTQDFAIPQKGLALAGGLVTFESYSWFTPAERGQSADQRHLALRVYSVGVK